MWICCGEFWLHLIRIALKIIKLQGIGGMEA
jgi:hypothetical protein